MRCCPSCRRYLCFLSPNRLIPVRCLRSLGSAEIDQTNDCSFFVPSPLPILKDALVSAVCKTSACIYVVSQNEQKERCRIFYKIFTSCRSSNTAEWCDCKLDNDVIDEAELGWHISAVVYHWLVGCSVFVTAVESLFRELLRFASFFLYVPGLGFPSAFCREAVDNICERMELFLQNEKYFRLTVMTVD